MTEQTMIERVARAMVVKDSGPEGSALFDVHWREFGDGYLSGARAAIEAMREPTPAIITAILQSPGYEGSEDHAKQDWYAAIDAALDEADHG